MSVDQFETKLRRAIDERTRQIDSVAPDLAVVLERASDGQSAASRRRVIGLSTLAAATVAAVAVVPLTLTHHGDTPHRRPALATTDKSLAPPSSTLSKPPASPTSATPPVVAAACRAAQLRIEYRAGTYMTQNDFGAIDIANTSSQDCSLNGRIVITPMESRTQALPAGSQVVRASNALLAAHGNVPPSGASSSGPAPVRIVIGGSARSSSGTVCSQADTVTPAGWQLSGATGVRFVPNIDPAVSANSRGLVRSVFTCSDYGTAEFLRFTLVEN
jgi:hypothetical protein